MSTSMRRTFQLLLGVVVALSIRSVAEAQGVTGATVSPNTAGDAASYTVTFEPRYAMTPGTDSIEVMFDHADLTDVVPADVTVSKSSGGPYTIGSAGFLVRGSQFQFPTPTASGVNEPITVTVANAHIKNPTAAGGHGAYVAQFGSGLYSVLGAGQYTIVAGPLHHVSAAATSVTAGEPFSLTLQAFDRYGNAATNYNGTVSLGFSSTATASPNNTAPTIPANMNVTFTAGDAQAGGFSLTNAGETPTITATVPSTGYSGTTAAITVYPAANDHFRFAPLGSQLVGTPFTVLMRGEDRFDNPNSAGPNLYSGDKNLAWTTTATKSASQDSFTLPAATLNFVNGVAAAEVVFVNAAETPTLTVTDGLITSTTPHLVVDPALPHHFTIDAVPTVTAGTSIDVTVTARDRYGNVSSFGRNKYAGQKSLTWSSTAHSAPNGMAPTLPSSTVTFVDGKASATAILFRAEIATLTATESNIDGTSNTIGVSAAVAHSISLTPQSGNPLIGAPFTLGTTINDVYGNVATGYRGTLRVTSSDSAASLPDSYAFTAADLGSHTFSVRFNTDGQHTLTVSDVLVPALQAMSSPIAVIDPVDKSRFVMTLTGPTTVAAGEKVTFVATGARVDNTLKWSASTGSISNGIWTAPTTPGVHTITAECHGVTETLLVHVVPGEPLTVTITPATATTKAGGVVQYTATASDRYGNKVKLPNLTWLAQGGTITKDGLFTAGAGPTGSVAVAVGGTGDRVNVTIVAVEPGDDRGNTGGSIPKMPAGARVLVAPVMSTGTGEVKVERKLPAGVTPDSQTLVYYYDSRLTAWIAVPTSFTATGAAATVPAGVLVAVLQGSVRQAPDAHLHWAGAYVLKMESLGLMEAAQNGDFHPDDAASRYEIARTIALAAGLNVTSPDMTLLTSLPDGDKIPEWAKPYVAAVLNAGLMKGKGAAGFDGTAPLSRAEMCTILGRVLTHVTPAPLRFTDKDQVPSWAKDGVGKAVAAGIISGRPDGSFGPNASLSRAEMAKIISILLDVLHP